MVLVIDVVAIYVHALQVVEKPSSTMLNILVHHRLQSNLLMMITS